MAATINILGVLDDGTLRDPKIPENLGRELRLPWKTDLAIRLLLRHPNGELVDLASDANATFILAVRLRSDDLQNQLKVTGVRNDKRGRGQVDMTIAATDQGQLIPRRFVYDIRVVFNGETFQAVPLSPFVVQATNAPG